MKKTIIILSLILALTSCNNDNQKNNIKNPELKNNSNIETKNSKKELKDNFDKNSKIETSTGKIENKKQETLNFNPWENTYVWFVGTFCPHCQKEMPILEKFYKENSSKVNMLMVVVDNKKFEGYTIPQKKQEDVKLSYEQLTKEKCWFVPSFVIYDKNKKIIAKKCWWALDEEWLKYFLITKNKTEEKNDKKIKVGEKKENTKEDKKTSSWALDSKKINNLKNNNKNMVAKKGSKVKVNYIWKLEDGKEFDNSYKRWKPLSFTVWAGQVIKGFDEWVIWMKVWDKKTIKILPKDWYGEINPNAKEKIEKSKLADFEKHWIKLEVWSELPTQMWNLKIIAADDKTVTVDMNHPLAWKTLIFEVEMVEVK